MLAVSVDVLSSTVVLRDTIASTDEIFKIRAIDRGLFCFEIRETFKLRATRSSGRPAAHNPVSRISRVSHFPAPQSVCLLGSLSKHL